MRYPITALLLACACQTVLAEADPTTTIRLEEILVITEKDTQIFDLANSLDVAPDSASVLRKVAGANVVSNGPLTGMAQYRGMSRFRVSTRINGATISAGGPNWMDPPLSYAPAAHLESLEVFRGISPVSAGQETIGGAIKANTWQGGFSDAGVQTSGRLRSGGQSVNNGSVFSAAVVVANENHLLKLSGLTESGDDAEFASGDLLPTQYKRDRIDAGYGFRHNRHTVRLDYGRNETGDAGTPALPMDIGYIDADLYSLSWQYDGEDLRVNSSFHMSDIGHGMSNFHLRTAPAPASWRRNVATGENRGFAISLEGNRWTLGFDGLTERHNSNIDNPNNPNFFVENFSDAERRLFGVFAERDWTLNDKLTIELGARVNHIKMDADPVNATPAVMGMPPAVALRDAFNAADRSQTDTNVDWVAKLNYQTSETMNYYAGVSRKSRSPAYQERYLWLPLQATAGLADGRTYTGNIELKAEIAHEVELGIDFTGASFTLSPRLFYRDVQDYIQGTVSGNNSALMFVQMMNMANGTNNALPLEFNNVDAHFYGLDIDWRYQLAERWTLSGVLNYVRAKRDDINDDIYRVAPPNAFTELRYAPGKWAFSVESFWYSKQSNVSLTNSESTSKAYSLLNLKGQVSLANGLKLGFGVDNIADTKFADHLNGINRVRDNPDIALGERLPGYGRNLSARLDFRW